MTEFQEGDEVEITRYAHDLRPPYPRGIVVGFLGGYIRVRMADNTFLGAGTEANCLLSELRLLTPRPSLRQLWSQP